MHKHPASLVDVSPGQEVTVRQILFDGLRAYCAERGLRAGCRVTLLERDPSRVLLQEADGSIVRCPADLARFVEVTPERKG